MKYPKYEVVKASKWLDQSRSKDPMCGRGVILKWLDPTTGETVKFSTNEQWEDSRKENWKNPKNPNYCYGHYFDGVNAINDEIIEEYYKRARKILNWYKDKPTLTIMEIDEKTITRKEMNMGEFHNFLANKLGE